MHVVLGSLHWLVIQQWLVCFVNGSIEHQLVGSGSSITYSSVVAEWYVGLGRSSCFLIGVLGKVCEGGLRIFPEPNQALLG